MGNGAVPIGMEAKAYNEAARALVLWGALQVDLMRRSQDEAERQAADDLLGLLTPVIKGYLTDKGFETAVQAQQVFGGHGYIREWGMEQFRSGWRPRRTMKRRGRWCCGAPCRST